MVPPDSPGALRAHGPQVVREFLRGRVPQGEDCA
jgi:hypothetical protein